MLPGGKTRVAQEWALVGSAASLSVWLPARGGGQKAKVTGGGPKASSDSEERPMRNNEEVFLILGSGIEAGASDSGRKPDASPVGGGAARAGRGVEGRLPEPSPSINTGRWCW